MAFLNYIKFADPFTNSLPENMLIDELYVVSKL